MKKTAANRPYINRFKKKWGKKDKVRNVQNEMNSTSQRDKEMDALDKGKANVDSKGYLLEK